MLIHKGIVKAGYTLLLGMIFLLCRCDYFEQRSIQKLEHSAVLIRWGDITQVLDQETTHGSIEYGRHKFKLQLGPNVIPELGTFDARIDGNQRSAQGQINAAGKICNVTFAYMSDISHGERKFKGLSGKCVLGDQGLVKFDIGFERNPKARYSDTSILVQHNSIRTAISIKDEVPDVLQPTSGPPPDRFNQAEWPQSRRLTEQKVISAIKDVGRLRRYQGRSFPLEQRKGDTYQNPIEYMETDSRTWTWQLWDQDTVTADDRAAAFNVFARFGKVRRKSKTMWILDHVKVNRQTCKGLTAAVKDVKSEYYTVNGNLVFTLDITLAFRTANVTKNEKTLTGVDLDLKGMFEAVDLGAKFSKEWNIREEISGAEFEVSRIFYFLNLEKACLGKVESSYEPDSAGLNSVEKIDGIISGPWDLQRLYIKSTDTNFTSPIATSF